MFFYSLSHTSDFRDFLNAWVFGVMRNQGFLENQYLIIVYSKTFVTIFVNKKARLQQHHDILKNTSLQNGYFLISLIKMN